MVSYQFRAIFELSFISIRIINSGLLAKVKEGAEKIQAKAESALLIKQEREATASRKSEIHYVLKDVIFYSNIFFVSKNNVCLF